MNAKDLSADISTRFRELDLRMIYDRKNKRYVATANELFDTGHIWLANFLSKQNKSKRTFWRQDDNQRIVEWRVTYNSRNTQLWRNAVRTAVSHSHKELVDLHIIAY